MLERERNWRPRVRGSAVENARTAPFGQEFKSLGVEESVIADAREEILRQVQHNPVVKAILDNPKLTAHQRKLRLVPIIDRLHPTLRAKIVDMLMNADEGRRKAQEATRAFLRGEIDETTMKDRVSNAVKTKGERTKYVDEVISQVNDEIVEKQQDVVDKQTKYEHFKRLNEVSEKVAEWYKRDTYVLEKNDCSRLHKLIEAGKDPLDRVFNRSGVEDGALPRFDILFGGAQVFVVRHDWAKAFENAEEYQPQISPQGDRGFSDANGFNLPFPHCVFEFRVSGHTVVINVMQLTEELKATMPAAKRQQLIDDERANMNAIGFVEFDGFWFCDDGPVARDQKIMEFCWLQIRAICIALEAEIATRDVMRQPSALNEQRLRSGRVPLYDYHVVDLARRYKTSHANGEGTHRSPRFHFRRGHWRHYTNHKTWIRWTLVGDPDLGIVDKEYRL